MDDLITVQEYKDFVGKTKNDDDARLAVIIPAVSNIIRAYLGNSSPLDPSLPIEEYINLDYEADKIFTKYWPVREIISIEEQGRYTYDSSIHVPLIANADYYLIDDAIVRAAGPSGFARWPMNPGVIKVTYKAGNVDINGMPAEAEPQVKLAALELTKYYLNQEYIKNRSVMGTSLSTYEDEGGMPPHIARLLDKFKE